MTALDAKRSGRALFLATQPHGTARETLDGLVAFATLLQEHADLREVLTSPFVSPAQKRPVVEQLTAMLETPPAARQTLLILIEMRQPAGLTGIIKELKTLVHRQEKRVEAEVTTAVPMTEAQVAALRETLAQSLGLQVELSSRVDPAIIGGAVTRVGTLVYDGSLARQLARMKEQFVRQG